MLDSLRLVAPLHNRSGYAKAGRALLFAAQRAGICVEAVESERRFQATVRVDGTVLREWIPMYRHALPSFQAEGIERGRTTAVSPSAPTLLMGNPHSLSDWEEYSEGTRIGLTMWESEGLHSGWARACENVDLLLVPSNWNRETAEKQIVRPRKRLFPLGVDERCWSPSGKVREVKDRPEFLFVSVFSTCERKGWRTLMQAFAEEFRGESVGLLVKPTRAAEVEELACWCRAMGSWVQVVSESLTEGQMGAFYRAGDAYVLPSAEGFGLPFVEAAMCGVPSIGLDGGGAQDPLTVLGGAKVPCRLTPCVGLLPQVYRSGLRWHACEVETLKKSLRRAYERICTGRMAEGDVLAERAVRAYGLEATGKRIREVLDEAEGLKEVRSTRKRAVKPLAVVVTTHNHLERTQACVESLLRSRGVTEIVLADDGSNDGTPDWAEARGVTCLSLAGGNVSANRQVAVEYLRDVCHWDNPIAFFDNDVVVPENWWEELQKLFEEEPRIGVVAPRKVYANGKTQNIGNRLFLSGGSAPSRLERRRVVVDYVETACMVVRPEVWRSVRWDARFPLFYEDVDYCFQARSKGFEVMATADVTVTHFAHTTSHSRASESERNRLRFLAKWKDQV